MKQTKNEPQLTAEMEKQIDDLHAWYINGQIIIHPDRDKLFIAKVGHFLATALEEQRVKVEVETGLKNFRVFMKEVAKARADERLKIICAIEAIIDDKTFLDGEIDMDAQELKNIIRQELKYETNELDRGTGKLK